MEKKVDSVKMTQAKKSVDLKSFLRKISKFLKRIFVGLKKSLEPKKTDKKEIKKLLSKEEFLRFKIIQQEISLRKAKTDLAKFLKKR